MPAPVAIDPSAIQIPFTAIVGAFTVLGASVAAVFRMLVKSNDKQIADLTLRLDKALEDNRSAWNAVQNAGIIRLYEVATYPTVSPQVKAAAIRLHDEMKDEIEKH